MAEKLTLKNQVRRVQRTNTIVLLHKLREAKKFNRESIKRSRQRIKGPAPRNEESSATPGNVSRNGELATPSTPSPGEKVEDRATITGVDAGTGSLNHCKDDRQIKFDLDSENCIVNQRPEIVVSGVTKKTRKFSRPDRLMTIEIDHPLALAAAGNLAFAEDAGDDLEISEAPQTQDDVCIKPDTDTTLPGLSDDDVLGPQFPELKIATTSLAIQDTNRDEQIITEESTDVEASKPMTDVDNLAKLRAEQDKNPFLQDLYRKERILLMTRIINKVEKVSNVCPAWEHRLHHT